MYIPSTKWTWAFLLIAIVQACIVLAFEAYAFAVFQIDLHTDRDDYGLTKAIPTFLALYIFGFLYDLFLVYDALRMKNTIQVIGLVLMNVGLLIYGAIQLDTIQDAVRELAAELEDGLWSMLRPYLITIPCVLALSSVMMAFVAWKLYKEFSWTIYKHISADLKMRRRYLNYQIYIALLKFDFFFFLGFTIQFIVIVRGRTTAEFYLTIAAIPVTIVILMMAAFFTRREILTGMIAVFILFFGGLAYFIFKLYRMYAEQTETPYQPARKELTTFAVITILLIVITIVYMAICCANFNKGLRPYISKKKVTSEEDKIGPAMAMSSPYAGNSYGNGYGNDYGNGYGYGQGVEMTDTYVKQGRVAPPARMEID